MANTAKNVLSLTARQLANTADKYGALKQEIARLQKQADDLADLLKEQGDGTYTGKLFECKVGIASRSSLDTAIVKGFLTPVQIAAATKTAPVVTLNVKPI